MRRVKAIGPRIVTEIGAVSGRPYYSIIYYDVLDKEWHQGYGSYELDNVREWFNKCFDVVSTMNDVELLLKSGNWIKYKDKYVCSECNSEYSNTSNYCPNCGARNFIHLEPPKLELDKVIKYIEDMLNDPEYQWGCEDLRHDHRQLREWLIELKYRREESNSMCKYMKFIKDKDRPMCSVTGCYCTLCVFGNAATYKKAEENINK